MRLLLGVAVINLMVLTLGVVSLWNSHQQEIQTVEIRSRNIAAAVSGNIGSTFEKVDVALRVVVDELEHSLREGGIRAGQANDFLRRQQQYVPEIDAIRVANAAGAVFLGPGTGAGTNASYGDRDFFAAHKASPDAGLLVTRPILGRVSKKWVISLNRRLNAPDGSFAGVVSASISVERLQQTLSRFDLGPNGRMTIRDLDWGFVVSYAAQEAGQAVEVGSRQVSKELADLKASGARSATYRTFTPADGIERIATFQRFDNAPYFLLVGLATSDHLDQWKRDRNVAIMLLSVFVAITSLGGWMIWVIWRREREGVMLLAEANERLSHSLREAQASETRFTTLFAASPFGLSLNALPVTRIVDVNPAYCAIAGYTRDELIGRLTTEVNIWADPEQRTALLERLGRDGRVDKFDMEYCAKDGHKGWASLSVEAVEINEEKFLFVVVEEISDRKHAEAALKESEQRFRGVFDSVGEGIFIHDAVDGSILMVNRRMAEMYGISPDEAKNFGPDKLSSGEPNYCATEALAWFRKAASEGPQVFEWQARRPHDGSLFWVEVNLRSARLGERDCFIAVVRDIGLEIEARRILQNQREYLEEQVAARTRELAKAKDAAEAANVAKSAFLANMSHEIRTPINAITGMAHLMRRTGVTAQQAERLEKIDSAGRHLLEIVSAVLDLSKIEAGCFALDETEISLGGIMASVAAMVRGQADAKQLELVVEDVSIPGHLLGDPIRLRQALLNYANNAVKFTASGCVRMRARVEEDAADSMLVRFEVQDTGVGIAPEVIPRLFAAFEQADNSISRGYGGTGLGLAVARKFAQLMGGDAGVESVPGVGSTFWLTVRLTKGKALSAPGAQPGVAETRLALDYGGRRVLLVEDEPVNREVTVGLLEDVDLSVDVAADGVEAVELAGINDYDLILMDMQMPRMDGLEATRRIRQLPAGTLVPILAMTANAFVEDRRRCLDAGMDDFITKPVDPETLFSVILNWLANPPAVIIPQPAAGDRTVPSQTTVAVSAKATLLIVDDSPENLVVLNELLCPHYRVLAATSGEAALRVAQARPGPDLILLDVMMPGMDGYAVLARLREDAATREIPVVFLTALSGTKDEEDGLQRGAVDYITKPIKPAVVLARVATQLVAKRARDWLKDQNATLEAEVARRMVENDLTQRVSIRALAHLAETRDPETGNHILRTQSYVQRLASGLRHHPRFAATLSDRYIDLLSRSAPLHDVGKVGVPDHILLKPGPLTPDEWVIMQTHARLGSEAIEQAEQDIEMALEFLTLAKEIAHWHHEKWDGRGYPDGLAGDEIPMSARLMALADVFDALVTPRVYKAAMPYPQARDIIAAERGRHFDPDVTDAFLAGFDDFVEIAERYRDVLTADAAIKHSQGALP
jgi:PAS domain S-box-containing protein